MRYPEGHKEAVRERIVAAATRALREHGLSGVSIPALMKSAGLTHGGFYSHFESRDELVAAAVEAAATETSAKVFSETQSIEEMLRVYLTRTHLEHPEDGCVLAALGPEGFRQAAPVRHAFKNVAKGMLRLVERKLHPKRRSREVSDEALRVTATMVGAVVLGRLLDDPTLAERLLGTARRSIAS